MKVSLQKPANLANLESTPSYIIDCDPIELENAARELPKQKVTQNVASESKVVENQ